MDRSARQFCIPIRLDYETEGFQLQETFCWISPQDNSLLETFVDSLLQEFELPATIFRPHVLRTMNEQISEATSIFETFASLCELHHMRLIIKLDIICNGVLLLDQVEWDAISVLGNDPELFANVYTRELFLAAEFKTAISHSIREQVFLFLRALLHCGYQVSSGKGADLSSSVIPNDDELNAVLCSKVARTLRTPDVLQLYSPQVISLKPDELERIMDSRRRESRRKKRSQWSISSPPKTHRTFIGYRGRVHRQMAIDGDDSDGSIGALSSEARRVRYATGTAYSLQQRQGAGSANATPNKVRLKRARECPRCGEPMQGADWRDCTTCNLRLSGSTADDRPAGKRGRRPFVNIPIDYGVPIHARPKQDPDSLTEEQRLLLPGWLPGARTRLDERYPLDRFSIAFEDEEFRMRCNECKKSYAIGPHQSLSNFETHLKNKTHRAIVERRLSEAK